MVVLMKYDYQYGVTPSNLVDDTNPEAESQEYIDSIAEDVAWMGWNPAK